MATYKEQYEKNLAKILSHATDVHLKDYDPYKKYEYYVKCKDSFFNDTQIILCENYTKANKIVKALNYYNVGRKQKAYTYITYGEVAYMSSLPRGKITVLIDSKHSWWNE